MTRRNQREDEVYPTIKQTPLIDALQTETIQVPAESTDVAE